MDNDSIHLSNRFVLWVQSTGYFNGPGEGDRKK